MYVGVITRVLVSLGWRPLLPPTSKFLIALDGNVKAATVESVTHLPIHCCQSIRVLLFLVLYRLPALSLSSGNIEDHKNIAFYVNC